MRALVPAGLLVVLLSAVAAAQEPVVALPDRPSQAWVVGDQALAQLRGAQVTVELRSGQLLPGRLVSFDPRLLLVEVAGTSVIVEVDRGQVARIVAGTELGLARRPPPYRGGIALQVGLGTGVVAVDVDARPVYLFAAVSIGVPALTGGRWGELMAGVGVTHRIRRMSAWQADLFVTGTLAWDDAVDVTCTSQFWGGATCSQVENLYLALGIGVGAHYTFPRGLTVAFKLPLFGLAFSGAQIQTTRDAIKYYYLSSALAMPIASVGFRF